LEAYERLLISFKPCQTTGYEDVKPLASSLALVSLSVTQTLKVAAGRIWLLPYQRGRKWPSNEDSKASR